MCRADLCDNLPFCVGTHRTAYASKEPSNRSLKPYNNILTEMKLIKTKSISKGASDY